MVGSSHEALHRIFQKDPAVLTKALQRVLHVPFPEPREIVAMNVDLTEIEPVERRVDTLMRAETDEGTYLLRTGADRGHAEQYDRQVGLSADPVRLPGWHSMTVRPLVLGPDNVPVITDEHWGEQDPSLAVFSAMTHGRGPQTPAILESLVAILKTVDPDTASVYAQFVDSCLTDSQAKQMWRDLMKTVQYFWRHPLAEQVREEGRVEGREEGRIETSRAMLLRLLEWRHIPVPTTVRARIESCTDLSRLETWAERAVHAADAEELFAEE